MSETYVRVPWFVSPWQAPGIYDKIISEATTKVRRFPNAAVAQKITYISSNFYWRY